jgi:hypothetical protein
VKAQGEGRAGGVSDRSENPPVANALSYRAFKSPDLGSFLWALSRENDGSFVGMSKP